LPAAALLAKLPGILAWAVRGFVLQRLACKTGCQRRLIDSYGSQSR
jgi:hypothetical protein